MQLKETEQNWKSAEADYRQKLGRIQAEKTRCFNQVRKAFAKHSQLVEAETALLKERQFTLQHLAIQVEQAEEIATWKDTPKETA
jgi:IS4 transposase